MREEKFGTDVAAEIAHVVVGPCRANLAIDAGLGFTRRVPAEAEAVAIGRAFRFQRVQALMNQRVVRRSDIALQRGPLASVSNPAAHKYQPNARILDSVRLPAP